MKQDQSLPGQRASASGHPAAIPARGRTLSGAQVLASRPVSARVLIRPARPDDLEEATLLERRVWGRIAATLNELQRRLFAFPEAFLLAELRRPGRPPEVVGLTTGLIWTRDFPRSHSEYESESASASHNPRGDVLYIVSLGVDPRLRGRGVGLRLLQEAIDVGRRRHLKACRLVANSRSETLFLRAGFQAARPLPRLHRQHRDLMPSPVMMELPLV